MQRPRREEFVLEVRRSAKTLQKPNVEADSAVVDTDAVAKLLKRAALWLTPKVVEHYDPQDFTTWDKEQQNRLRLAIEDFKKVANQVRPNKTADVDQFKEGSLRFRNLIDVLGKMVLDEWLQAIETVEKQAEDWSKEAEWRTRRVDKKLSESLLGTFSAPQLLIFAEPYLYVLDPVARFIPEGLGAFDFAIQPSYHTTSLYRDDNREWHVHLEIHNGALERKPVKWGKDAFLQCVEQLGQLV